jgi:hypothetical protein
VKITHNSLVKGGGHWGNRRFPNKIDKINPTKIILKSLYIMGIQYLNKYLCEHCLSIKTLPLRKFKNKTIVIDTSIYMYKFLGEGALVENMRKMIQIFRMYEITPLFVFDGRPPPEKKELIVQRNKIKYKAETEYNELLTCSQQNTTEKMQQLKTQFLRIGEVEVNLIKELFDTEKVEYFVSTTEADPLCVYLVHVKKAYACLTEDMDMFVYGCENILRNINLEKHQIQHYSVPSILKELKLSQHEFKQIMILSGTDYDIHHHTPLYKTLNMFEKYKTLRVNMDFYEWLTRNYPSYIQDREKLNHCFDMFDLDYYKEDLQNFSSIVVGCSQ